MTQDASQTGQDSGEKSQGVGRHERVFSVTFSSHKVFISQFTYQRCFSCEFLCGFGSWGQDQGEIHFRRRRWRRQSQEDLSSTVSAVQTSCYDFQGIVQSQPCQDTQGVQGVATGSGWQWGYRSGIVVGPALDTMASTARITQGLKEDEEVEKTTLSETLNTASLTFKHLTVKQIFPREPYHLKVHRDAQYVPKPPGDNGFSDSKVPWSYQMSHRMCLDTEELARRSAIYASLTDSMVASVIEEFSPKDERTKLLREQLAIIQQAQVSAVSAGFAAASNLQLIHRDALLKNFGFQPQVLSTVRTARFEGSHVSPRSFRTECAPSGKRTGWLARRQVQHESDGIQEDGF